ncbi:universal stress protein [Dawidia soli]|uniref:Universal stress protein n=1 Tax=Dawidia soli TaxID=2782352 RepID=A0AAP2GJ85_9BACT|nr:universal stress protein [Dawidia soli]MBT1688220.1 universal stress protein [Dawidia soli]
MVNILVPTDLSELSKASVQYAVKIANKLGGTLTLLHVMNMVPPTRTAMRQRLKALEKELVQTAQEDLETFAHSLSKQVKFPEPIRCRVAVSASSFTDAVRKEARKQHTGLIVMGTHGASGLKKVVLGSNTTTLISASAVPVLAVPEGAAFKGFRNMIYATDMRHLDKELKMLVSYVEKFNTTIHLVHIASSGRQAVAAEEKLEEAAARSEYKKIVTIVLVDTNLDIALDQYIENSKADVLAMFTHGLSFYEKLFNRSLTRRMAFHVKIPLLAFKQ